MAQIDTKIDYLKNMKRALERLNPRKLGCQYRALSPYYDPSTGLFDSAGAVDAHLHTKAELRTNEQCSDASTIQHDFSSDVSALRFEIEKHEKAYDDAEARWQGVYDFVCQRLEHEEKVAAGVEAPSA